MPDVNDWLSIGSATLRARIDPLGAQLSQLQDAQRRDLLWDGDPAFWNGRAPLLFPIVGALAGGAFRWRGRSYALPRHGFARGKRFEIVEARADSALLRLSADASTKAVYPFDFQLDARFSVVGRTLSLRIDIRNRGPDPMPASFGFHPAFRWPLPYDQPRSGHRIEFETDEPEPIRRLDAQGLIEPRPIPSPIRQRTLQLNDQLFIHDALILDRVRSQSVTYGCGTGPSIEVRFPHTPYLGLWSKSAAPFVCIEPWHGIADPEGFSGELDQKPGIFEVAPGAARELSVDISLKNT